MSKNWVVARSLRLGIAERVDHADAVDRILLEAVDDPRRRDLRQFVDRRDDVDHVVELRPRRRIRLDPLRPGDGHRLAGAAEVGAHQLGALVRRAARPRPSGVVHVVGLRAAERIEAAEFVQRLEVLRDRGRDAVLRELLADGAVQALRRGTVVAPDVEDQRVVELAFPLDLVDDPAGVVVGVLGEAGEHFHQAALERLLGLGDRVPRSHGRGPRRELRVLRNPALGLGARKGALAILVPAVVELALVLVGPLLHDLVRAVRCARRPVHEERLVRRVGLLLAQPVDRVRPRCPR